jgi:hypothetical protein
MAMVAQSGGQAGSSWRRAGSCSPAGDNCVEIRHRVESVDIRDSKATFQMITVGRRAWRLFVADLS